MIRQGWRSCLQRGEKDEGLLKGEASGSGMAVWQWVRLRGNQITALPHGWIDYCPLTPRPPASKRGGFSLPEVLFALLLMALSSSTLLHYHRALALGFSQQWYQREAWRVAEQQLMGHESPAGPQYCNSRAALQVAHWIGLT
ncbi:Tfp pilus assembly protein PilV [Pantoea agglomerans]|uniref:Tfp pilus assembly protein PilV n=1 Tax=Enterobacter agglomerans TaxID=549 RepID=A0A379ABL9_ENTAG|nr:Tfp pilus assembly protein PilV [Pantoea agglomerans]